MCNPFSNGASLLPKDAAIVTIIDMWCLYFFM